MTSLPLLFDNVRRMKGLLVYALNTAPWTVQASIDLANPEGVLPMAMDVDFQKRPSNSHVDLVLAPGELFAFKVPSTRANVIAREAQVIDREQLSSNIGARLQQLTQMIGALAQPHRYEELSNSGFELDSESVIGIPGWLAAQHPIDGVTVVEGKGRDESRAVQLVNDGKSNSRTWLLSNPISPPTTGRLAVRCLMRWAESSADSRFRCSIEDDITDRCSVDNSLFKTTCLLAPTSIEICVRGRLEVIDLPAEGLEE